MPSQTVKRADGSERPNYAGMRKQEIAAAIENAPDVATLDEIDADLKRIGYDERGTARSRIAELRAKPDGLPAVARVFATPSEE